MVNVIICQRPMKRDEIEAVCINGAFAGLMILGAGTVLVTAKLVMSRQTGDPHSFGASIGLVTGLAELYGSRWIARNIDKIDLHQLGQGIALCQVVACTLWWQSYVPRVAFLTGALVGAANPLCSKIVTRQETV